ncbi:MAG: hypothetical protein IT456_15290 [Planctomycetes bacterium]|nr:hypothetical protein [Planctomycetota bacterium]
MSVPQTAAILVGLVALGGCGRGNAVISPAVVLEGDLEPLQSALTYHTPEYHVRLRQVLMKKAPDDSVLQFLVMPSFAPETLLSLHRVGQGYEVVVISPKEQIWYSKVSVGEIECIEARKSLPSATAEQMCVVWKKMLLRTRYTEAAPTTLDGVAYAFLLSEQGLGDWGGRSSNPRPGTRPDVLAQIGEDVIAYVRADAASEQALLTKVGSALAQLEASLAK